MNEQDRVLIVGTEAPGGINHYIEQQRAALSDHTSVEVYRSHDRIEVEGVYDAYRYLVGTLVPLLLFPFRARPSVVHIHTAHRFSFYRSTLYVFVATLRWRQPVVLHVHGSSFDTFVEDASVPVRVLQRACFACADAIVVLSEQWANVLDPLVRSSKVEILPNAVNPDAFDPDYGAAPPHLVFVSILLERKGVEEFLQAVERLKEERDLEFSVSIAGSGPLADTVETFTQQREYATYHGYVSESEKRRLMSDGSIFVLPSYAEGLPFAILEGMAGGNALITTSVGSIPEVVTDRQGLVIEPGDGNELERSIATLVGDPRTVVTMGKNNRRIVEDAYSWSAVTEELLSLYDELCGKIESNEEDSSS